MKAYIITTQAAYNYGAVLQCYALRRYMADIGFDAEVIDYRSAVKTYPVPMRILRYILRFFDLKKCKKVYGRFLRNDLNLTPKTYKSCGELSSLNDGDVYIAGSDQIWNCKLANGKDDSYFLAFVPENSVKFAYAASIADCYFVSGHEQRLKRLISALDAVSVREKSAAELLGQIGVNNVETVLDPTLLVNSPCWEDFAEDFTPDEKYILVYSLNRQPELYAYARKAAKELGIAVYAVSNLLSDRRFGADRFFWVHEPRKFVALFRNAEAIVANSFHGLCFSLIFSKNMHIFPTRAGGNSRLEDMLSQFGLENRMLSENAAEVLKDDVDFEKIQAVLAEKRAASEKFISDILRKCGD